MEGVSSTKAEQSYWFIPKPALFRFEECLWFLDRNYDDCLHHIDNRQLRKAIAGPDGPLLFGLDDEVAQLKVTILQGKASPANIGYLRKYLSEYIDLLTPLQPFYERLAQDERLAYMAQQFRGLRLIGIPDLFEALAWCIIGQQINLSFAYRLKRRLVEAYGQSITYQENQYYIFPSPGVLSEVDVEVLRRMQFSGNKANYLIGIARLFEEQKISKEILQQAPDQPTRLALLTEIRGIGLWTANYVLMKCLREKNCIPYGDTGLTAALRQHAIVPGILRGIPRGTLRGTPSRQEVDAFFRSFEGWQSYLVFYLWRSLSVPPTKKVS